MLRYCALLVTLVISVLARSEPDGDRDRDHDGPPLSRAGVIAVSVLSIALGVVVIALVVTIVYFKCIKPKHTVSGSPQPGASGYSDEMYDLPPKSPPPQYSP